MKTDKPLQYYKWHWQDWRSNRTVQRMSYIERGLYRELLDECWVEGSIPDDMDALADICGCPADVMRDAWQMLSKCFEHHGNCYTNKKLDSMRTERDAIRASRALAGSKGGLSKSLKEKDSVANAKQLPAVASVCHIEEKSREEKEIPPVVPQGGQASGEPSAISGGEKPEKRKAVGKKPKQAKTITEWLDDCKAKGVQAIGPDDPIRQWADDAGIPDSMMRLAWLVFVDRWKTKKAQKDWPAVFRNAIRDNWLKLWYVDGDNQYRLTTAGIQESRRLEVANG